MGETLWRSLFLESAFVSKPWHCWSREGSDFAFCPEAPVCNKSPVRERRAAQHEFNVFGFLQESVCVPWDTQATKRSMTAMSSATWRILPHWSFWCWWLCGRGEECVYTSFNNCEEKHAQQAPDPWRWCSPLLPCISEWWLHMSIFKWDTSTNWGPPPLIISEYFDLLLHSSEFYGGTKKTRKGVLVLFGGVNTKCVFSWAVKGQVLLAQWGMMLKWGAGL